MDTLQEKMTNGRIATASFAKGGFAVELDERHLAITLLPENEGVMAALTKAPQLTAGQVKAVFYCGTSRRATLDVEIPAASFAVASRDIASKDCQRIETIVRESLLDACHHPVIRLCGEVMCRSVQHETYEVVGNLSLRGQEQALCLELSLIAANRWKASFEVSQTAFGIAPLIAFGGSLRSKDIVRIVVEVDLTHLI